MIDLALHKKFVLLSINDKGLIEIKKEEKAKKKMKGIVKEQKIIDNVQNIIQQEIMITVSAGVTAATIAATN